MSEIHTIGIVGDGQLGRMITEAALPMGFEVIALGTAGSESPAAQVGAMQLEGKLTDADAIRELADRSDVVTWEIEHINARVLENLLREGINIQPHPSSLFNIQDKLSQKLYLTKKGIQVAPFMQLDDVDDLYSARARFDDRVIVKSRRGGYDGRGNLLLDDNATWTNIRDFFKLSQSEVEGTLYAEQVVDFRRELAWLGARGMDFDIVAYPLVETVHHDNICHTVTTPVELEELIGNEDPHHLGLRTLRAHAGAGVMAVEMFETTDGRFLVNEIAPRVHNSGHWTDLGAETSQFEQHVRAITGMELGSTEMTHRAVAMVNILGSREGPLEPHMTETTTIANGHIRWYGKSPRPDRKIGHITVYGETVDDTLTAAQSAREEIDV